MNGVAVHLFARRVKWGNSKRKPHTINNYNCQQRKKASYLLMVLTSVGNGHGGR